MFGIVLQGGLGVVVSNRKNCPEPNDHCVVQGYTDTNRRKQILCDHRILYSVQKQILFCLFIVDKICDILSR